jgi:hypothetical protein
MIKGRASGAVPACAACAGRVGEAIAAGIARGRHRERIGVASSSAVRAGKSGATSAAVPASPAGRGRVIARVGAR